METELVQFFKQILKNGGQTIQFTGKQGSGKTSLFSNFIHYANDTSSIVETLRNSQKNMIEGAFEGRVNLGVSGRRSCNNGS